MIDTSKLTYELKEKTDNAGQPIAITRDSVIEKRGHVIRFTLAEIAANKVQLEKAAKEIAAQRDLEDAKMKNVEHFHPEVKVLTQEQLATYALYYGAKHIHKQCLDKLVEIEKMIADEQAEVAEIKRQIPELDVPEPIEAPAPQQPEIVYKKKKKKKNV